MGFTLADQSFIPVDFELVIVSKLFICLDVSNCVDQDSRLSVRNLDPCLAIRLNKKICTSQL